MFSNIPNNNTIITVSKSLIITVTFKAKYFNLPLSGHGPIILEGLVGRSLVDVVLTGMQE